MPRNAKLDKILPFKMQSWPEENQEKFTIAWTKRESQNNSDRRVIKTQATADTTHRKPWDLTAKQNNRSKFLDLHKVDSGNETPKQNLSIRKLKSKWKWKWITIQKDIYGKGNQWKIDSHKVYGQLLFHKGVKVIYGKEYTFYK